MSTCNQLDLKALGSQPVMSKNLPDHWPTHAEFLLHQRNFFSLQAIRINQFNNDFDKVVILDP